MNLSECKATVAVAAASGWCKFPEPTSQDGGGDYGHAWRQRNVEAGLTARGTERKRAWHDLMAMTPEERAAHKERRRLRMLEYSRRRRAGIRLNRNLNP